MVMTEKPVEVFAMEDKLKVGAFIHQGLVEKG
jgi:hypothetical protein